MSDVELDKQIEKLLKVANLRGLDKLNPIPIKLSKSGKTYIIVVALTEPSYVTIPLNALWLVADEDSPDHRKVLRRVSQDSFGNYRDMWVEVTTFADLFAQEPEYTKENTFLLGEIDDINLQAIKDASNTQIGVFRTATDVDPEFPVIVGDNDPRMTDARYPVAHTHDNPRSVLISNDPDTPVVIGDSNAPTAGSVLFITTGDVGKARWRQITEADVKADPKNLTHIALSGPNMVNELETPTYTVVAYFDSGTPNFKAVTPVWSLNNTNATINPSTGVLTPKTPIFSDKTVRLTATYSFNGVEKQAFMDIQINDVKVPVFATILPEETTTMGENSSSAPFSVRIEYDDTTTATLAGNDSRLTWSVGPSTIITSVANGVLTVGNISGADFVNVTLKARFQENGFTLNADKVIKVLNFVATPVSMVINDITGPGGVPNAILENQSATFTATVTYSNGTTATKTPVWSLSDTSKASVNASGTVSVAALDASAITTLNATYTENGATVLASKNLQLLNNGIVSLAIDVKSGVLQTNINEGSVVEYKALATYADGTTQIVTDSVEWSVPAGKGVITTTGTSGRGIYTAPNVSTDTPVTITVSTGDASPITATLNIVVKFLAPVLNPRFGVADIGGLSAAFIKGLPNTLPNTSSGQTFTFTFTTPGKYGYFAHPASLNARFIDSLNFEVGLDGALWPNDGSYGESRGPAIVQVPDDDGVMRDWKLYRTEDPVVASSTYTVYFT
jgi:hypothetical protein